MRITVMAALAAATFALAPLAHAGEGNGEPFPFNAGPIGAVQVVEGTVVALPDQPALAYAARDEAAPQATDELAELPADTPAERSFATNDAPAR